MAEGVEQRLRELGEFIRDQREGARLSLRGLSSRTGISNPYLSQIERGLRKPSAEILQQIARGLAISAETLYERAGHPRPPGRPPTSPTWSTRSSGPPTSTTRRSRRSSRSTGRCAAPRAGESGDPDGR